jgi:hypothetical protein
MKNLLAKGSNQYIKRYKKQPDRYLGFRFKTWMSIYLIIALMLAVVYFGYTSRQSEPGKFVSPLPQGASTYTWSTPPVTKHFEDKRAQKLFNFLNSVNSPLAPFADTMVHEADKNAIDWTLVPAISGKESSFGKAIPENSFNAWGIMAWDAKGNRSVRAFTSWSDSIAFEAKLLSTGFRKDMYGGIQRRYCPSFECSSTWTSDVAGFSAQIAFK